jgi:ABC-type amino acid transport substrate-binding protein
MKWILTICLLLTILISPLSAQELTGTLQQIQKSGKFKIGYRQDLPPMSFLGKEGVPAGYSIDICEQIATEITNTIDSKIEVEYVPVTSENRLGALSDNKIDILCGATTKTLSRGEKVDFTQLTFVTGASFMSLRGTKIRNNFDGKKIGVAKGTTTAVTLKNLLQETEAGADIILLDSSTEALAALEKGTIDAYAADQIVLIGLAIKSGKPTSFSVLPDLFSYEPFALAVRRNDADFRLIADRVISDLYRSRQILKIYDKWVGEFTGKRTSAFEALIKLGAIPE